MSSNSVKAAPPVAGAYSIQQFCDAHNLSYPTYYRLRRAGEGPDEMHVGARRLISIEAAERWRREREKKTGQQPEQLEPEPDHD